jgi:hypothetical protein
MFRTHVHDGQNQRTFRIVATFVWSLAALLLLTVCLQVYVLHPATQAHPAFILLILFGASWVGVLGLLASVSIAGALLVVPKFRHEALGVLVDRKSEARAVALNEPPEPDLARTAYAGDRMAWDEDRMPQAVPDWAPVDFDAVEELEEYECLTK